MNSLPATIAAIEESLEENSWLFIRLSQNNNTLALPYGIVDFLTNVELPMWAAFYSSDVHLGSVITQCIFNEDESSELERKIELLSPQEAEPFVIEIQTRVNEFLDEIHPDGFDIDALASRAVSDADALSAEKVDRKAEMNYLLCTNFLLHIFNFLSLMSHGRTMYDIVQAAMSGCEDSFYEAIQIDRTVLIAIPFFQKRLLELQLSGDKDSLDRLSRAMGINSIGAQYDYPDLRLVFSLLHRTGHLDDMPGEELLTLCLRLKVYKGDSVKALAKRKRDFLKSQPRPG